MTLPVCQASYCDCIGNVGVLMCSEVHCAKMHFQAPPGSFLCASTHAALRPSLLDSWNLYTFCILEWYSGERCSSKKKPLSGMQATLAAAPVSVVVALSIAASQWSQCRNVASPPAEQPETITSVALDMPRSVRIDSISASRMLRPRKCSVVLPTTVGVVLSPDTEAPSQ